MDDRDVQEWLWMLPIKDGESFRRCKDSGERAIVIKDLLKHARSDKMTPEDQQVCRAALASL